MGQHISGVTDHKPTPRIASGDAENTNMPGQETSGTDRSETDSERARQAHQSPEQGTPPSPVPLTQSEEARNQDATSKQSRALSGTTAPSKV
jgi:hypothetical protein